MHLKLYPLLFVIGFIIPEEGWIKNIKRLVTLGLLNVVLVFIMGGTFLKEYLHTLTQYAGSPSVWISNISLYAYITQISGYLHLGIGGLKALSNLYILLFFGVIVLALYKGLRGDNSIVLFLIVIGATLFPTVSFDYKIILITLCAAFFFSTYHIVSTQALLSKNNQGKNTSFTFSGRSLLEYFALGSIVFIYPYTLYSYVYKADWGILGASDTTPLLIISFALMLLIVLQPKQKRQVIS